MVSGETNKLAVPRTTDPTLAKIQLDVARHLLIIAALIVAEESGLNQQRDEPHTFASWVEAMSTLRACAAEYLAASETAARLGL